MDHQHVQIQKPRQPRHMDAPDAVVGREDLVAVLLAALGAFSVTDRRQIRRKKRTGNGTDVDEDSDAGLWLALQTRLLRGSGGTSGGAKDGESEQWSAPVQTKPLRDGETGDFRANSEIARLRDVLSAPLGEGDDDQILFRATGGVVQVTAAAGMGKSATLRQVRTRLESEEFAIPCVRTSCVQAQVEPLSVVASLASEWLFHLCVGPFAPPSVRKRPPSTVLSMLLGGNNRASAGPAPAHPCLLTLLIAGLDMPLTDEAKALKPEDERQELEFALLWLLRSLTDALPAVVLVDDFHWIDNASRRLLTAWAALWPSTGHGRVRLLVGTRPIGVALINATASVVLPPLAPIHRLQIAAHAAGVSSPLALSEVSIRGILLTESPLEAENLALGGLATRRRPLSTATGSQFGDFLELRIAELSALQCDMLHHTAALVDVVGSASVSMLHALLSENGASVDDVNSAMTGLLASRLLVPAGQPVLQLGGGMGRGLGFFHDRYLQHVLQSTGYLASAQQLHNHIANCIMSDLNTLAPRQIATADAPNDALRPHWRNNHRDEKPANGQETDTQDIQMRGIAKHVVINEPWKQSFLELEKDEEKHAIASDRWNRYATVPEDMWQMRVIQNATRPESVEDERDNNAVSSFGDGIHPRAMKTAQHDATRANAELGLLRQRHLLGHLLCGTKTTMRARLAAHIATAIVQHLVEGSDFSDAVRLLERVDLFVQGPFAEESDDLVVDILHESLPTSDLPLRSSVLRLRAHWAYALRALNSLGDMYDQMQKVLRGLGVQVHAKNLNRYSTADLEQLRQSVDDLAKQKRSDRELSDFDHVSMSMVVQIFAWTARFGPARLLVILSSALLSKGAFMDRWRQVLLMSTRAIEFGTSNRRYLTWLGCIGALHGDQLQPVLPSDFAEVFQLVVIFRNPQTTRAVKFCGDWTGLAKGYGFEDIKDQAAAISFMDLLSWLSAFELAVGAGKRTLERFAQMERVAPMKEVGYFRRPSNLKVRFRLVFYASVYQRHIGGVENCVEKYEQTLPVDTSAVPAEALLPTVGRLAIAVLRSVALTSNQVDDLLGLVAATSEDSAGHNYVNEYFVPKFVPLFAFTAEVICVAFCQSDLIALRPRLLDGLSMVVDLLFQQACLVPWLRSYGWFWHGRFLELSGRPVSAEQAFVKCLSAAVEFGADEPYQACACVAAMTRFHLARRRAVSGFAADASKDMQLTVDFWRKAEPLFFLQQPNSEEDPWSSQYALKPKEWGGGWGVDGEAPVLLDGVKIKLQSRELGRGAFGSVLAGVWAGADVAVKFVSRELPDMSQAADRSRHFALVEALHKEAGIWVSLRHPNVVPFFGLCFHNKVLGMVMALIPGGNALSWVGNRVLDRQAPTAMELAYAIRDIAAGMAYLSSQSIVHGDLALRNCLVDGRLGPVSDPEARNARRILVCDFGLASATGGFSRDLPVPVRHAAPEMLLTGSKSNTTKLRSSLCDVFSFGTTCWECYVGGIQPYTSLSLAEVRVLKCNTDPPSDIRLERPLLCDTTLYESVMLPCWSREPDDRPSFGELLDTIDRHIQVLLSRRAEAGSSSSSDVEVEVDKVGPVYDD
jgi:Protein tyrosine and serine/threonine kinase/AAA ATPase domain